MENEKIAIDKETATEMTEYIEVTSELIDKQAADLKQLREENEQLKGSSPEKPQEKQAGEETGDTPAEALVLTEEKVATTVDSLIGAGLAKQAEREDLIERFKEDPNNLLMALEKVASLRNKTAGTVAPMGKVAGDGRTVSETPVRDSDAQFERQFG